MLNDWGMSRTLKKFIDGDLDVLVTRNRREAIRALMNLRRANELYEKESTLHVFIEYIS